jgi:hypothetical protein
MANIGNQLSETYESINNFTNKKLSFLNTNVYLAPVLGVLLVLYASLAAPKLPKSIVKLFDNMIVKLVFIFLLCYTSTHSPISAIVISVCILLSIQMLAYYESSDKMLNLIHKTQEEKEKVKENENKLNVNGNHNNMINISNETNVSGVDKTKLYSYVNNDSEMNEEIVKSDMSETNPVGAENIIGYTDPDYALY